MVQERQCGKSYGDSTFLKKAFACKDAVLDVKCYWTPKKKKVEKAERIEKARKIE